MLGGVKSVVVLIHPFEWHSIFKSRQKKRKGKALIEVFVLNTYIMYALLIASLLGSSPNMSRFQIKH